MKLAVIVPTLPKNTRYTVLCLGSVIGNTDGLSKNDLEIYPALNGDKTDYPQGQCAAVNRIAKLLPSDIDTIMVANDDMYFPIAWDRCVDWNSMPKCWSPNLIEPVGIGSAPPFLKFDGGVDLETFSKRAVNNFALQNRDEAKEPGFNLPFIIDRELWDTIGGYDEYYDPWGSNSDTDLQMKIELAGVKPIRNRGCLVYHFGSKSETFTPDKQEFWWQNWHYLEKKWGFNRDQAKSNTWYCENMIMKDKLIYHPEWEGKYK
jgi:hypothetical protein